MSIGRKGKTGVFVSGSRQDLRAEEGAPRARAAVGSERLPIESLVSAESGVVSSAECGGARLLSSLMRWRLSRAGAFGYNLLQLSATAQFKTGLQRSTNDARRHALLPGQSCSI